MLLSLGFCYHSKFSHFNLVSLEAGNVKMIQIPDYIIIIAYCTLDLQITKFGVCKILVVMYSTPSFPVCQHFAITYTPLLGSLSCVFWLRADQLIRLETDHGTEVIPALAKCYIFPSSTEIVLLCINLLHWFIV